MPRYKSKLIKKNNSVFSPRMEWSDAMAREGKGRVRSCTLQQREMRKLRWEGGRGWRL